MGDIVTAAERDGARAAAEMTHEARRIRVTGVVQGVGFRPFVHRLATELAVAGWVRNRAGDVEISVEGSSSALTRFVARLHTSGPPLARIVRIDVAADAPRGVSGFAIVASDETPRRRQPVLPDAATCGACLRELHDPADRRHRYPFITCTDCGPRYTLIERLPYDRERTSMAAFEPCAECEREYRTPGSRRHHSETNACAACGPVVSLERATGAETTDRLLAVGDAAIAEAARALRDGAIVAVRGLGGFHLAVDATSEGAVSRLRERKHREGKPFAVMVRTVEEADGLARISPVERELLASPERPIVLLAAAEPSPIAPSVAPSLGTIGVMLAYTPLHDLLLDAVGVPLVMTSGNRGDEPIVAATEEAHRTLGAIADLFLVHDREIVRPVDDSVCRVVDGAPRLLRRSRGWAPLPVPMPLRVRAPILAVGAHLKNTFTLAADRDAFVSPHIGDLDALEALDRWHSVLAGFRALYGLEPRIVARDAHPGYASTRIAEEMAPGSCIVVQHHHAHIAAVMGEHGVREPVLGVAYDGTGYGDDGKVWGGELLVADLTGYRRVGRLRYAPLPGGDLAVRSPWRAALGYLSVEAGAADCFALALAPVHERERELAWAQAQRGVNAPEASSMGRLFDAAAAVIGVCHRSRYEGEAAMRLEALAGSRAPAPLPLPVWSAEADGVEVLDPLPLLAAAGARAIAGADRGDLAAAVHDAIAAATADGVRRACEAHGLSVVALGGGVFQNARLLTTVRARLERAGLRVLDPRLLPANDGGVSYGQAVVAAALLRAGIDQPRVLTRG